jgi:O-antigen/teichoic acid export membrane protein
MSLDIVYLEKNMRSNIFYNYFAQIFLATISLVTLPFLLQILGAELYAFVAILFMIQTIFSVLDGGFSGSLSREFALNRKKSTRSYNSKKLLNKTEYIFATLAIFGSFFVYLISSFISNYWLRLSIISPDDAQIYIGIIGIIAAIRLWSGLYRSVLIGYEKQKLLSLINIAIASCRYIFILPLLDIFENAGFIFFLYQLALAIFEIILLKIVANKAIDEDKLVTSEGCYCFRSILKTSSQIWLLTLVWVAANQIDKLLLSRLLSLQDFGYFSVISSLSAGILLLGAPVGNAVMPNLSRFIKLNNHEESRRVYFAASKLVSMAGFSVALTLIAVPKHVLFLFVNDVKVSADFSTLLQYYSIGSFFLLMSGMTFLLKQSSGDLSENIKQNIYYLVLIVFLMIAATSLLDLEGAAYAWFFSNLILIIFIIKPLNVINKINFHYKWLYEFIVVPSFLSLPVVVGILSLNLPLTTRFNTLILIFIVYMAILFSIFLPLIYSKNKYFGLRF